MLPKRDFLGTQAQPLGIRSQCPPPPQPCGKTIIANFAFWRWHHRGPPRGTEGERETILNIQQGIFTVQGETPKSWRCISCCSIR